jgi:DNA-binding LacI/PurR family transcriptional regulator
MKDVADRVGVSRPLVSLVFRGAPGASAETRARVFQAAEELGYRPDTTARVLRRHRSQHLGVLFTMQQPHDVDLVEAIYPMAQQLGYDVVLGAMTPTRDTVTAVEELLGYRSEALILIGPANSTEEIVHLAEQVPVVVIGRRITATGVDNVRVADDQGIEEAVAHLVSLGHKDIAHLDGGTQPGAAERRRGYGGAMQRYGLSESTRIVHGDYTEEAGAHGARQLLEQPPLPTAVIAANDRCAFGLLDTLIRAGVSVPRDVSVVGYDDSRIAGLSFVNLTTIRQDAAEMAELAVKAAAERLDDERTEAKDIVLKPTLIVRNTTAPPRPQG